MEFISTKILRMYLMSDICLVSVREESKKSQINEMNSQWKSSSSTVITTSGSDVVGQKNKIGSI